MRKSKVQTVGEIIRDFLKETNFDRKICEYHVKRDWEKLVGKTIANATIAIYFNQTKMFVNLNSSVVRNELLMNRSHLIEMINQTYMKDLVLEIICR